MATSGLPNDLPIRLGVSLQQARSPSSLRKATLLTSPRDQMAASGLPNDLPIRLGASPQEARLPSLPCPLPIAALTASPLGPMATSGLLRKAPSQAKMEH